MKKMKGVIITIVLLVSLLVVITPVSAQNINCLLISGGSTNTLATLKSDFEAHMTGINFDTYWADTTTPSLSFLQSYDVVLLLEDGTFSNAPNVGNVVYSYVMGGGNLVIGTFYEQDRSDCTVPGWIPNGWGNLEAIDPFTSDTFGCKYAADSMDPTTIVSHPIMNGVSSLWMTRHGGGNSPKPGTTVLAYWTNPNFLGQPDPVVGYKFVGSSRLVHVSIYPAYEYWGDYGVNFGGDFYTLWENAIKWAAQGKRVRVFANPIAAFIPVKNYHLRQVNTCLGCIEENLPEDVPSGVQALLDEMQEHINNANTTGNTIYANNELLKALKCAEDIQEILGITCPL